jgi:hypothetical protein
MRKSIIRTKRTLLNKARFSIVGKSVLWFSFGMFFMSGFLLGCRTNSDLRTFDREFYWRDKSLFTVASTPQEVCKYANDSTRDRSMRCRAVFQLFASFVKPGFTSQQMRSAIPDNKWLSECSVSPCGAAGGGSLPIYNPIGYTPFLLRPFPDKTGWSDWCICFNLRNALGQGDRTPEEALAFLAGTHTDKRLKLMEFAFYYPICGASDNPATEVDIIERFQGQRVGLKVPPR